MISNLRESKAKLSELVDLAASGEDVLITVRGKPKARLTGVKQLPKDDRAAWIKKLRALHKCYAPKKPGTPIEEILDDLREDLV